MKASGHALAPIVVEWSPNHVRVYDPVTHQSQTGRTLAECFPDGKARRDAVVAVGPRSTFIRTVAVPSVSRDEVEKMVAFKVGPLLPLSKDEYVAGFRLGKEAKGDGKVAVVGAVKTGALRRIHEEAEAVGLRVRAVVPQAFGSWMAARARSLQDCAVVRFVDGAVQIDVVTGGELRYSRTIPQPDTPGELGSEINKTFTIAEVPPVPVLAAGATEMLADYVDQRDPIEYLTDPKEVQKLLFNLELPERTKVRRSQTEGFAAQRALIGAIVAVAVCTLGYWKRTQAEGKVAAEKTLQASRLRKAREGRTTALKKLDKAVATKGLLDSAFSPGQSTSDIVTALSAAAPADTWLTGVTVERGKRLLIRGQARNGQQVAKYNNALSRDPRFRKVKLDFATNTTIGKITVVQFAISAHAVGNLPIVAPKTEEAPK